MGSLGSAFLGSAISLKTHLFGTLVKHLCLHFLFWRWSRFWHKRIRGIGSQAASRRGAKSRRLALAFKARSFFGSDTCFLVLLLAALPVVPALLLTAAVPPLRLPLCLLEVSHRVPPAHTRARLFCPVPSCPDHARPSHGWATLGSMLAH